MDTTLFTITLALICLFFVTKTFEILFKPEERAHTILVESKISNFQLHNLEISTPSEHDMSISILEQEFLASPALFPNEASKISKLLLILDQDTLK